MELTNIFNQLKVLRVAPDATAATTWTLAAGTTDVNSAVIDTSGYRGVAFLPIFGDNADTATFTGKIQGSANGTTGWTDITDASFTFTAGASDTDNELGGASVYSPLYQYVRFVSDRGVANTVLAGLLVILYSPTEIEVAQETSGFTAGTLGFIVAPGSASTV
jgi:hypothetical protein